MSSFSSHPESQLVAAVRSGDDSAFRELHRRYWASMVQIAAGIVTPELAQDVVQDVMFLIWRRKKEWSITGSLDAYMHRAARNRALEVARREKLASNLKGDDSSSESRHPAAEHVTPLRIPGPEEELLSAELSSQMRGAIDSLSPRSREAFLLARARGLPLSEVARTMGVSIETVKTQLKRATAALRVALKGYTKDD